MISTLVPWFFNRIMPCYISTQRSVPIYTMFPLAHFMTFVFPRPDFFTISLWQFMKYVEPVPTALVCYNSKTQVMSRVDWDMLRWVWEELDYCWNICCSTKHAHLEYVWINLKYLFTLCKWLHVVGLSVVFEYFIKAVKQVLAHSVLKLILRKH